MKNRNLEHKDDWETPDYILNPLKEEFGEMFDPCPLNHDVNDWDGLKVDWKPVNFVNPPYSRSLKEQFIMKAFWEWAQHGRTSILLLPVSTSTKIFHSIIYPYCELRFIKGRIKFKGINTKGELVENKCGMHDSMICIFSNKLYTNKTNVLKD